MDDNTIKVFSACHRAEHTFEEEPSIVTTVVSWHYRDKMR